MQDCKWHNKLCVCVCLLLVVLLFSGSVMSNSLVTPWAVAHQAPLSMGLPRQEYWRGLPFPSPVDLSDPWMEPVSPALAGRFLTGEPPGKPRVCVTIWYWMTQLYYEILQKIITIIIHIRWQNYRNLSARMNFGTNTL